MTLILLYFRLLLLPSLLWCWNEWEYKVTWSSFGQASSLQEQWEKIWANNKYRGNSSPPRPRRGHSLHIIKTDDRSIYNGDTYLVMFGGRDNDQQTQHIPKTYNVESVNGTIVFTTYDEKPVNPCNDIKNDYYSADETIGCNFTQTAFVEVGLIYNDVWAYKLCDESDRDFDGPCQSTGWELWHPGALQGGCVIQLGIQVCTVPSERYNHGSVMFDDGCLYVYGGFSERCQDFCDDIWFFDIYLKSWRQVYAASALTYFYNDTYLGETIFYNSSQIPVSNSSSKFAGPSKRWRHTMVAGKSHVVGALTVQKMAIFGGHRLWHGFSAENSYLNDWTSYVTRPNGGYLSDLWIYTKILDNSFPGQSYRSNDGRWEYKQAKEQCYASPGLSWDSRNDIACTTISPIGRAGHGSAFDDKRNLVWIFGGYNTYFPYPSTDGVGSGPGVTSIGSGGFIPYPGYPYFLNDLWYYNLSSNLWIQVDVPPSSPVPDPRMDAVFLLLGDTFFLHGGFSDNFIFGDTWYFNITTSRWLKKEAFVRPLYAESCTDDFLFINDTRNNCSLLKFPFPLQRDPNPDTKFDILPYTEQPFYSPNQKYGTWFGFLPRNSSTFNPLANLTWNDKAPVGTPIYPYAATGPMQYVRPIHYEFDQNTSRVVTLFERCTSVFIEPTRGMNLDGSAGRASAPIFVASPRRQKPGWDGCRDRFDGRTDLPVKLQFVQPLPRYGHRAVFHAESNEIFMYGGLAYYTEQPQNLATTYPSTVLSDMWYYSLFHCVNNCSFHGSCYFGFCFCDIGYYGVDCSNVSCPGTYCYYDEISFEQVCVHGCQAGYVHTDNDVYVEDVPKLPCTSENPGEVNGVCNGFGNTICAPPYITEDCSVKDCKANCSFNGWCSVEFPVSRCMCQPGYYGEICEFKVCLNNCSYPNGLCDPLTGVCQCNMMYSPYNNTREYKPWDGEDCSYLFAYEAAWRSSHFPTYLVPLLVFLVGNLFRIN